MTSIARDILIKLDPKEIVEHLRAEGRLFVGVDSSEMIDALLDRGDLPQNEYHYCSCCEQKDIRSPLDDLKFVQQELLRGRNAAALALLENIMRGLQ